VLSPEVIAARRIEELDCHPHPFAGLANAALDHISNTEPAADFSNIHRLAAHRE
jgi:hypothetical protein